MQKTYLPVLCNVNNYLDLHHLQGVWNLPHKFHHYLMYFYFLSFVLSFIIIFLSFSFLFSSLCPTSCFKMSIFYRETKKSWLVVLSWGHYIIFASVVTQINAYTDASPSPMPNPILTLTPNSSRNSFYLGILVVYIFWRELNYPSPYMSVAFIQVWAVYTSI